MRFILIVLSFASATFAQSEVKGHSSPASVDLLYQPPQLTLATSFADADGNRSLDEREKASLTISIANCGSGKAYDVSLKVEGTLPGNTSLDKESIQIGTIEPGGKREALFVLTGGERMQDGKLDLTFSTSEKFGKASAPLVVTLPTRAPIPPNLVMADFSLSDAGGDIAYGNGDGKPAPGETIELTLLVQNTGRGDAGDVKVAVQLGTGLVNVAKTEFNLGDLASSASKQITTGFSIPDNYGGSGQLPIEVVISEAQGRYGKKEKLPIQLNASSGRSGPLESQRVEIAGRTQSGGNAQVTPVASLSADIDKNIPAAVSPNRDGVAVIIGNRNYSRKNQDVPDVDYALRDAAVMKEYLLKALGYQEGNILTASDATLGDFNNLFGTAGEPGRISHLVKLGKSDIFIYYAGHGAPDVNEKKGYFVPIDCHPDAVARNGYPLELLYANLGKIQARSITVVIDACFSGSSSSGKMLIASASPVGLRITDPAMSWPNGALFTSSSGAEISSWYDEKKHGLFTYFFLKGMQGAADADQDGRVTAGEIQDFVSDQSEGVPYLARRLFNGRDQTPGFAGKREIVIRGTVK